MNYTQGLTVQETAEHLETNSTNVQLAIAALNISAPISLEDVDRIQQWIVMHPTTTQPRTKNTGKQQQPVSTDLAGASLAITTQVANSRQPLAKLVDKLVAQQESDAENLAMMLNPAVRTQGVLLRALNLLKETEQEPVEVDFTLEGDEIFTSRLEAICGVDQPQLGSGD